MGLARGVCGHGSLENFEIRKSFGYSPFILLTFYLILVMKVYYILFQCCQLSTLYSVIQRKLQWENYSGIFRNVNMYNMYMYNVYMYMYMYVNTNYHTAMQIWPVQLNSPMHVRANELTSTGSFLWRSPCATSLSRQMNSGGSVTDCYQVTITC